MCCILLTYNILTYNILLIYNDKCSPVGNLRPEIGQITGGLGDLVSIFATF